MVQIASPFFPKDFFNNVPRVFAYSQHRPCSAILCVIDDDVFQNHCNATKWTKFFMSRCIFTVIFPLTGLGNKSGLEKQTCGKKALVFASATIWKNLLTVRIPLNVATKWLGHAWMHVLTAEIIIFSMISGGRLSNPVFITSFVVVLLLQPMN